MNHFFKFLKEENIIKNNPMADIKYKNNMPPTRPRVVLSVDEIKSILSNAKTFDPEFLYPFLFTLANTGARRSEILKLKRDDVDFNTGLIFLRETKNGEDRYVRMTAGVKEILKMALSKHKFNYVFANKDGNRFPSMKQQRKLNKFQFVFPTEKNWKCHALRHSFAHNFLKSGGEMYQLQAILGHKHIATTVDLYGQLGAQDIETPSLYE